MTPRAKAEMAALTGRIALHRLRDAAARRPPRPDQVPATPEDLTADWLTAALCSRVPGARVTDFAIAGRTDGTSSRRVITVDYNPAGVGAGLPTSLFAKSTPTLLTRLVCGMNGLLVSEGEFYSRLRPTLDIEAPRGYHAVYDGRSCRSLFLLENVAETRGATFAGPADRYVDRARAQDMVDLMAVYHARFWDRPELARELAWLPDARGWFLHTHDMMNVAKLSRTGVDRAAGVLPAELVADRRWIWPAFRASLDHAVAGPLTALHQDVHAGNWYVSGAGRMGLYDWQCMAIGSWAIDLSYALMSGLTVADRRAWERDLITRYLSRLAEHGVRTAPDPDTAWLAYRRQAMHGLVFWLVTIGVSRLQPDMQPRAICLTNLQRMGQAVLDLDTLDSLGPFPG